MPALFHMLKFELNTLVLPIDSDVSITSLSPLVGIKFW